MMRYSRGMPMGDYTHCAHCERMPSLQLHGFYLCDSCRERAEIVHYWDHGVEQTSIWIDGEGYHADTCYSLNPEHE